MKTEVVMKRYLFDCEIKQKSKSEFLSSTDLIRAGNKWRAMNSLPLFRWSDWIDTKSTMDFIKSLEKEFGTVIISGRGRGKDTWIHPYLFLDLALALSPDLKIKVYDWVFDNLLQYRNSSGDSYRKLLIGSIYPLIPNLRTLNSRDIIRETATKIRQACGVTDWQTATEEQLILRDKIHEQIFGLSNVIKDIDTLVQAGIDTAKRMMETREKPTSRTIAPPNQHVPTFKKGELIWM